MILRISRKRIKEVYMAVFFFVLIFAPPILPHMNLILAVFSFGMLMLYHSHKWSEVFKKSGQLQWGFTILFLLIYAFIMILINAVFFDEQVQVSHYTALFNRFIILTISVIPSSMYAICYMKRNRFSTDDFIKAMIRAGMIQVVCVFASFLSDEIKAIFIYFMKTVAGGSAYDNTWYITVRSYGFAKGLSDLFGLGMGLIASLSYIYGINKEKRYVLYSVLIAVAGSLSARSTIIVYIVAVVTSLIYIFSKLKFKLLLRSIIYVGILVIFVVNLFPLIEVISPYTHNWLMQAVKTVTNFFVNDEMTGTFSILFSDRYWQIPKPFQMIFGSGHSLYRANGYLHSDVGYINDLWFVGILGIVGMYGSIALLFGKAFKSCRDKMYKMCILSFGAAVLVFNIKASVIGYNPGAAVLFSVIFALNYFAGRKSLVNDEE